MPLTWQAIENYDKLSPTPPQLGQLVRTERAKVLGGWLVRTYVLRRELVPVANAPSDPEFSTSVAMCFVPDPTWAWVV
jgi:hypothetical protein